MKTPAEYSDIYIYGTHAVMEALQTPNKVLSKVFVAPGRKDEVLYRALEKAQVPIFALEEGKLPKDVLRDNAREGARDAAGEAVHQGVLGIISPAKLLLSYKDFISTLTVTPDTALVLLGEVQDPHNVGAIIRSAAGFGIAGVLIPQHNQAQITGSVIKVSAGMAFRVPLVSVGNVNTAVRDLKEKGFWIYGLDGESKQSVGGEVYDRPSVFILGNEGRGLREKTREVCDVLVSIPMHPQCESFNVSVSAALALYSWSTQHKAALERK